MSTLGDVKPLGKKKKHTRTDGGYLCRRTSLSTNRCQRKPPLSRTRSCVVLHSSQRGAANGLQGTDEPRLPACTAAVNVSMALIGCNIRGGFYTVLCAQYSVIQLNFTSIIIINNFEQVVIVTM